ncbi:hypothetical protein [Sulfoacidibacillus thermotolerans]|uniref:Uncharacterized protein n=1 Tax=Sulfoacidibacillus thermotolerans TaxID=1765684 RepID=A0A2U3D770_SULT2|nr:hypothetical protein [Sulfoacidibacillus thermotolerans]PWI57125.1 hypothetical protein BM613_10235 [Sulfoacidibacillus thermotolerans]
MGQGSFGEFFSELSAQHLQTIYENVKSETLDHLMDQVQTGSLSLDQILFELTSQLPTIIFDLSAVMTIHLLHSYHEWQVEQK